MEPPAPAAACAAATALAVDCGRRGVRLLLLAAPLLLAGCAAAMGKSGEASCIAASGGPHVTGDRSPSGSTELAGP